jgi:8-oxo-dGTP pyrophosphatase MutT (NUDIX family)
MSAATKPATKFFRLSQLHRLREAEQVAAICYRLRGAEIEFLLVKTRGGCWTFPKGGVEPGLTHAQAAAVEAFEEAGVHGRIAEGSFTSYRRSRPDSKGAAKLVVYAHLCEVLRLGTPKESGRNRTWFSPEKARQRLQADRIPADGAAMARVVSRAVARIEQSMAEVYMAGTSVLRSEQVQNDALQKVQFESPVATTSPDRIAGLFTRYIRAQRQEFGRAVTRIPRLGAGPSDHPIQKVTAINARQT